MGPEEMRTSGKTAIPFLFMISSASKLDTALVFSTKTLHYSLSALAEGKIRERDH